MNRKGGKGLLALSRTPWWFGCVVTIRTEYGSSLSTSRGTRFSVGSHSCWVPATRAYTGGGIYTSISIQGGMLRLPVPASIPVATAPDASPLKCLGDRSRSAGGLTIHLSSLKPRTLFSTKTNPPPPLVETSRCHGSVPRYGVTWVTRPPHNPLVEMQPRAGKRSRKWPSWPGTRVPSSHHQSFPKGMYENYLCRYCGDLTLNPATFRFPASERDPAGEPSPGACLSTVFP